MARLGTLIVTLLLLGAASAAPQLAAPEQVEPAGQGSRARERLSAKRPLATTDVEVIQAAVRAALAGKYAVQRVVSLPDIADSPTDQRQDEYLLDDQARIRFHRYLVPDTAHPGVMRATIREFTDRPAVRCHDGKTLPGRRLGITYTESWNGWHIGNPMAVDVNGMPWAMGSPGYELLHTDAGSVRDLGERSSEGRSTRGFNLSPPPRDVSVWIDVHSLLPVVERTVLTMQGKQVEVSSFWTYPPPRPIGPPPGVKRPDCL